MATFKKVLVVIVMIIAVIGMASCLAGIIGGWVVNTPLTRDAVAILTGLSKSLEVVDTAITDAGNGLDAARGVVSQVRGITDATGDTLDQSRVAELATLAQGKLTDAVATLQRANRTIVGTVQAVSDMITTLNRIPGVSIKPLDSAEIDKVSGAITEISNTLGQVVSAIESARSGVADALARLREAVGNLDARLSGLEAAVAKIQSQIRGAQAAVDALIVRVPALIDSLSVSITVLLLWLGFAQFGLFMWMRSIYRKAGAADEKA
jgi:hypothetical protein